MRVREHIRNDKTFVKAYTKSKSKALTKRGREFVKSKMQETMHKYKNKALHSFGGKGKTGAIVENRSQAIAIGLSKVGRGLKSSFIKKKFK